MAVHHQAVESAWLGQSWKGPFVQRSSTQAFDLVSWRLSSQSPMARMYLCMFLVPTSLGCGAVGIVISPLVGLIEQQVSTCMMHVISVYYVVRLVI